MKGQKENKYSNSHRFWATFFVVVLFGLASLLSRVSAATYDQFTFQARLLSKDKQSAPSGSYNFRFTIYNSSSGGTQLWQETVNSVAVDYGKFTTTLGAGTSLSGVDFSSANLYLAVEFDSDGNGSFDQSFSERMPLTAVPVAQNANRLGGKAESAFASLSEDEIITGAYIFQNTLTAQGSLSAQGNIALGNDSGDLINFGGRVNSTIEPNQTATHDLGSSANKFKTAYLTNLSVTDTVTLASSLNGLLKVTAGAVSTATVDTDFQQVVTWGDGLEYSGSAASIDYNATNLKITATELNTIQDIAITSTPQFGGLTVGSVGAQQVASTLKVDSLATIGSSSANSAYLHFNRLSSSRYGDGSIGVGSTNAPAMQILMGGYLTNTSTGTATANVYDAQSLMTFGIGTTAFGIEKASVTSGNAFTSADFTSLFSVTSAGQVKINIGSSTGGINLGDGAGTYDTNLYRSAANSLKTDDSFLAANLTSAGLTSGRVTYAGTAGILQDSANMTFGATYGLTLAAGSTSALQFSSTAGTAAGGILFGTDTNLYRASSAALATQWSADSNGGPNFVFRKSRGSTGSETIVNSSDTVGSVVFQGYDGSSWVNLATISSAVDATPGSGDMPGVIIFKTTPDGSSTLTEGLRVDSAQKIWIGGSVDTNLYRSAANTLKTDDSLVIAGTSADLLAQGDLRFYDSDSTNYIGFQAPATVGTNLTWTLPDADGGSATVLKTNGSGTLYWDTDNTAGAGSGTLDDAYNNGRTITVDAGPIILNDSGTTTSLFDINQSGAITSTAPLFDVDYSGSINNAADYSAISLTGVTNAGAGNSIGLDLIGFDYGIQTTAPYVLSASKAASSIDFLSKKPDDAGGYKFLFDTSAAVTSASLFAIQENGAMVLSIDASGNLLPGGDNTLDFGSSSYRWQDGYFSSTVNIGSTLILSDSAIKDSNGALNLQANNDSTNYLSLASDATDLTLTSTDGSDFNITAGGDLRFTNSGYTYFPSATGVGNAIVIGGDASLYRSAAGTLYLSGIFTASSGISQTSVAPDPYKWVANVSTTELNGIVGINLQPTISSSRNISAVTDAVSSKPSVADSITVPGSLMHYRVYDTVLGTGASLGTQYGLYIPSLSAASANYAIYLGGTGSSNGITLGADTNIYRSAANTLKTDDALTVSTNLSVGTAINSAMALKVDMRSFTNGLYLYADNSDTSVIQIENTDDATAEFVIDSVGKTTWRGDTNLYRSTANTLKTDDSLIVASSLQNDVLAGVGNRAVYSTAAGVLTNSSSDATLKTNVISLTNNINALDTVSQLRGVYYNWLDVNKMGSQREIGLIAQEVQPHLPELIGTNADGTLSIDYPKLTAVLVEAVKQLNTEVEALSGPLMTAEQLTSPASKDLVLTAGSGQIVANSALTINGSLAVAGAFTVKGQGEGDYELDGTEDDTSMTSATERAAVANGQTETVVAIPSQGNNNYSVLVTWLNDPGQPHWVTVVDSEHFKVRFTNAVLADSIFRYLIIDNE